MMPRLAYKRTGLEYSMPAKKIKKECDYGYLKNYQKVKELTLKKIRDIPLYRKLEQAPKFEETKNAISYMRNLNAITTSNFDKYEDTVKGLNCLVLNRLLKHSTTNLCKQDDKKAYNQLSQTLNILLEVDDRDIKTLNVKQKYSSKNLAADVYDNIKDFEPSLQDNILNSFNMYLIDDGTGKGCSDDKINKSHLTIFGYPQNYSSLAMSINSPLIDNIIAIEQCNIRFNDVDNLEISTQNKKLKQFIKNIFEVYPELMTMFDTSLKKKNGLKTLKNTLLSLKALHNDNLFKKLEVSQKNILISAIILNNISQSNEKDPHDRIVQNANDAFLITNKYCNLEDKKLISNLILIDDNEDMINYACGLDHSFGDGEYDDKQKQNKIDDSIATIFKGKQIVLYYLFQKYGKNNVISPQKFNKLKNYAAIANNIDLIIREALDITKLPNNPELLYFNCINNNASCIKDGILTKDKNGFIIIDISKMQHENIPQTKQEQYFKEMGINCKTVEDFRLLIHGNNDLDLPSEVFDFNEETINCDPQRAITNMISMESNPMGYQRLCTTFISNTNNHIFAQTKIGFIINPDKTIFLHAANGDIGIASKDAYTVHCFSNEFGETIQSQDIDKIKIQSMNMEEVKQNYPKEISQIKEAMLQQDPDDYNEISIANINVAGIVIGANIADDEVNPYNILKESAVADYVKSKNIPIIKIDLNS